MQAVWKTQIIHVNSHAYKIAGKQQLAAAYIAEHPTDFEGARIISFHREMVASDLSPETQKAVVGDHTARYMKDAGKDVYNVPTTPESNMLELIQHHGSGWLLEV